MAANNHAPQIFTSCQDEGPGFFHGAPANIFASMKPEPALRPPPGQVEAPTM
jgi:hypothetical protein